MSNRDEMIKNEQTRQADLVAWRKALMDELTEISEPVRQFRAIEARIAAIEQQLQQAGNHSSAVHADFKRKLERAMPDELREVLSAAQRELSARRRPSGENPAGLRQLANLREWHSDVRAKLADPTVSDADLVKMAEDGRGLLSPEGTVANV